MSSLSQGAQFSDIQAVTCTDTAEGSLFRDSLEGRGGGVASLEGRGRGVGSLEGRGGDVAWLQSRPDESRPYIIATMYAGKRYLPS